MYSIDHLVDRLFPIGPIWETRGTHVTGNSVVWDQTIGVVVWHSIIFITTKIYGWL